MSDDRDHHGELRCLHDREELWRLFARDPLLHLYELGDLDPFFWPRTTWYGWRTEGGLAAAMLVYASPWLPTALLFFRPEARPTGLALLTAARPLLPRRFFAHLSSGCLEALAPEAQITRRGRFLRLGLTRPAALEAPDTSEVERLGPSSEAELRTLYERAHPEGWFEGRMLETGRYFGLRHGKELVAAAGVHVVSEAYEVAALGNIATAPSYRRRGLASRATARLGLDLLDSCPQIGLNVRSDNGAALALYQRLGFEVVDEYDEVDVQFTKSTTGTDEW